MNEAQLTMKRLIAALILLAAVALLSACGGGESAALIDSAAETAEEVVDEAEAELEEETEVEPLDEAEEETEAEPEAEPDVEAEEAAPEVTTISHTLGETEIVGVPERVVALEWTYVEDLLALGIQPVGVADIAGYETWVNVQPELADDVTDVGTRQEPNLEAIAALEPDLIIGVEFRHAPIYEDLSSIAPTIIFNPYPAEAGPDQFAEMEETFLTIAEAVQRQGEASEVLADMEATFAEGYDQLEAAGLIGSEFVLAQAFSAEGGPQVRLFTDNSMAVQIFNRLGLENAWEGGFEQYGFSTVGIEALAEVQDANFLYVVQSDDDVFANQADNPVWNSLQFVQEDRTYPLGGDTWLFGGPLSAELVVEKTVDLLTE
ncbi:MAG: iron-siderophore ABC transporter substrate-binding protein [Candidatus Promineifilaceae bacterium]|nr:iron-siderophore ABC transporter substrate-binding protein [Candidatus Promineifilaceae bacterium]